MPKLNHPLHSRYGLVGTSFDDAMETALQMRVQVEELEWDMCQIVFYPLITAHFKPSTLDSAYLLGEIGFAYVLYRLSGFIDKKEAFRLFRLKSEVDLNHMLKRAHQSFKAARTDLPRKLLFISLDEELLGILVTYTQLANSELLNALEEAGLAESIVKWQWFPLSMEIWIKNTQEEYHSPLKAASFISGTYITNGESGHRSLSFWSSVWSQSLHDKKGRFYLFKRPLSVWATTRHIGELALSPKRLKTMSKLGRATNEVFSAFDFFNDASGAWGYSAFLEIWPTIKGREVAKLKTKLLIEDLTLLVRGAKAMDVVIAILEAGLEINRSSMIICQKVVDKMIDMATHTLNSAH